MKAEWESLTTDIDKHARGIRDIETGRRLANMSACAKDDPKRYAKVNAEAMAPIYEAKEKARAEAKAKAEAEEADRQKRLEARAQAQHEKLMTAIDQRIAQHGAPTRAKRK